MEETPFEDRHVPRAEIEWTRSVWWWRPLTRAVHPAIKVTTLFLGLAAIWIAKLGLMLGVRIFQPKSVDGSAWVEPLRLTSEFEFPSGVFTSPIAGWLWAVLQSLLSLQVGIQELAFLTFAGLWLSLVVSLAGGLLSRRAMVELGQQTIAPWGETCKIVFSRWLGFLWLTGMHFVGLLALLIPIAVLGGVSRLGNPGAHIAGVLLIIMFPLAFAVGRMMMSLVFCYPLGVCAIAAEKKADAFEGFSRSNAYLFQRPVLAVACALLLAAIGLVGEQLVMWTLTFGWGAIRSVFFYFGGAVQAASDTYVKIGNQLTVELLVAYWFSFFWAAAACVYLILRRSVDSTDIHELDSIEHPVASTLPEIPTTPPPSGGESNQQSEAGSGEAPVADANESNPAASDSDSGPENRDNSENAGK